MVTKKPPTLITWDDSLDNLIRAGYMEGRADSAIAEEIGAVLEREVTRASVYSRARSLGLVGAKNGNPLEEEAHPRFQRRKLNVRPGDRLIVFGDSQVPFHDKPTLAAINKFMGDFEPTAIVNIGDFLDFYPLSVFDQDPRRLASLQDELDIGGQILNNMSRRHPKADKVLIQGNHEDRLRRFIWQHPGISGLRDLNLEKLMRIEGDWQVLPYKSMVEYGSLLMEHGDVVRQHSAYTAKAMFDKRGSSGIVGHTHRFGVFTRHDVTGDYIYIENGCTCRLDPEYAPFPNWQHAFTYVIAQSRTEMYVVGVPVKPNGFRAEGRWYRRDA